MEKNEEITILSKEIMVDITDNRIPLHNILLKCSRLSLLVNLPHNVKLFQDWAKYSETNSFIVGSFNVSMESAKDPNVSLASANPSQYINSGFGNSFERSSLRASTSNLVSTMANYRSQAYGFASNIFQKWQFGNIAQTIFEMKRSRTEETLRTIFPDVENRLNSIEQNLRGSSSEDWKNAVTSCRTLLMDISDLLSPIKDTQDKQKYINRLKEFVDTSSKTRSKLVKTYLEELKKRIEYTVDLTQGGAHQSRPLKKQAEDVVLYTYLVIADLIEIYNEKNYKEDGDFRIEPDKEATG